jgi:lipid-A-disaccharide synthase
VKPKRFMLIAGEASGDTLAAELIPALREQLTDIEATPTADYQPLHASLEPRFFGAGGPRMAAAGVELAFDMTAHSVIGLSDAVKNYFKFRRIFNQLYRLALEREPDAIICIDFFYFNASFARAIRNYTRPRRDWFHDWRPKIIQYVSPQVWASREERAREVARNFDLLLSIVPFEKDWYAKRVRRLRVEFVGHPILDRYGVQSSKLESGTPSSILDPPSSPLILLLPASRPKEVIRHVPVMLEALKILRSAVPTLRARMVLPNETLVRQARTLGLAPDLQIQAGDLPQSLSEADLALAKTGTITLDCAYFGVPTVTMYKTSRLTYEIVRRIVKVNTITMPNLLANEPIFPEFVQDAATPQNIAAAALELLRDEPRRAKMKMKLSQIIASLGSPGARERAAKAIIGLLPESSVARRTAELAS